jgi:hypothetical protein
MAGWLLWAVLAVWLPTAALAQTFSSGSTGAQGAFPPTGADAPPTGTTQYSLSLTDGKLWYVPGWTLVTLPNVPAGGFRDGVLNFTTFSVPSGVTMYFYKNAANTPVTLLATGSVSISGAIDVSGAAAPAWGRPGTGGPGGFDGGAGGDGLSMTSGGVGLGPGGGGTGTVSGGAGGGGSYGSTGVAGANSYCSGCTNGTGGAMYGSGFLRPIIGGSGGGGSAGAIGNVAGGGGGGGGGAILIVSSSSITLNSSAIIRANGGSGYYVNWSSGGGGGGAGGAIRLIAPTITGTGSLYAQGGTANYGGGTGGNGRIRLEATTLSFTGSSTPLTVTSLPQPVFPSTGQPALAVTSIGGMSVPANPVGSVLAAPDVLLPVGTGSSVAVTVTASNVPIGTTVQLTAAPQSGNRTTASCALLDGSQASSSCTAGISIQPTQTNILMASAVFPLVASAGEGPVYAEGEEVKWVRVASVLGGPSTVTYITATGKEVPATALASRAP